MRRAKNVFLSFLGFNPRQCGIPVVLLANIARQHCRSSSKFDWLVGTLRVPTSQSNFEELRQCCRAMLANRTTGIPHCHGLKPKRKEKRFLQYASLQYKLDGMSSRAN